MVTDPDTVVISPSIDLNEFQNSTKKLIDTLQNDNKALRIELSGKEAELKECTDELANIINGNKANVSESYLIASLQASRKSISELDVANRELLDALQDAQDEVFRLSSAGMTLNKKYIDICMENSNMKQQIDECQASESQSKLKALQEQSDLEVQNEELRAALDDAEENHAKDKKKLEDAMKDIESMNRQLSQYRVENGELLRGMDDLKRKSQDTSEIENAFREEKKKLQKDNEMLIQQFKDKLQGALGANKDLNAMKEAEEQKSLGLLSQIARLEKQLKRVSDDLSDAKSGLSRYKETKSQISQLKDDLDSMYSNKSSLEVENEKLKGEIVNLEASHCQLQSDRDAMEKNMNEKDELVKSLRLEMKEKQECISTTQSFLEKKQMHQLELDDKIVSLTKSFEEVQARCEGLMAENSILSNKIAMLNDENTHLKSCLNGNEEKLKKALEDLNFSDSSLHSAQGEILLLKNKTIALQDQQTKVATQHTMQIEKLHAQIMDLIDDRDTSKFDLGRYATELDMSNSKVGRLKDAVDQSDALLQSCKIELVESKSKNGELHAEVDRLRVHIKGLQEDVRNAQTKAEHMHKKTVEIDHLMEENKTIRLSGEMLTKQLKGSNEKIVNLNSEISMLKDKLAEQEALERRQHDELRKNTSTIMELTSSLEIAQASLKEAQSDLHDTIDSLKSAKLSLESQEKANLDLIASAKQDDLDLKHAQQDLKASQSELLMLKNQLLEYETSSKEEISTLEELNREHNETIASLKDDVDKYSRLIDNLERQRNEDSVRYTLLQEDFKNISLALDKVPTHICTCDLQSKYEACLDEMKELRAQNDQLVQELNKSNLSRIGLERECEHVHEELEDLYRSTEENQSTMDEQDEVINGLSNEVSIFFAHTHLLVFCLVSF